MIIAAHIVKQLRDRTGSSMVLCKKALEESDGNIEKALVALQKSSEALASKKSVRSTGSGCIETYVHGQKIGVLLELRCETDFVARTLEFRALAHDIALHIAGLNPHYISAKHIPEEDRKKALALFTEEVQNTGKPKDIIEKIIEGKMATYFKNTTLLDQPFVKDSTFTVAELLQRSITHFGENIEIARFARFEL